MPPCYRQKNKSQDQEFSLHDLLAFADQSRTVAKRPVLNIPPKKLPKFRESSKTVELGLARGFFLEWLIDVFSIIHSLSSLQGSGTIFQTIDFRI
jgi:hypothetical protein